MRLLALLLCLPSYAGDPTLAALAQYSQTRGYSETAAELRQVLDETADQGTWNLAAAERALDRRAERPAPERRRPRPARRALILAAAQAVNPFPAGPGLDRLFDKGAAQEDDGGVAVPGPAPANPLRAKLVELQALFAKPYEDMRQPWADSRWAKAEAILATAKDAGEFDYLYYRVHYQDLQGLPGPTGDELRAMIARWHAVTPGRWDDYLAYLDTAANTKGFGPNRVDFLVDGEAFRPVLFKEIERAQVSIHLELFQLQAVMSRADYERGKAKLAGREPAQADFVRGLSDVGWLFAEKLAAKARGGDVHIHILLDEHGTEADAKKTRPFVDELIAYLESSGVEVHIRKSPRFASHLDHRKLFIFDGKVAFAGGMNIGQDYQVNWHDQQTRIEGPAVAELQRDFVGKWESEHLPHPGHMDGEKIDETLAQLYPTTATDPDATDPELRVVLHHGGNMDHNIKAAYLRAIATAEHYIHIATPYFSDEEIVDALCAAAKRHVEVVLIFPAHNDVNLLKLTARSYYPRLLKAGIKVYEYLGDPKHPRMAHQKVAVIDGKWATFGSSNLDERSLDANDELNVVTVNEKLAAQIEERLFKPDLDPSRSRRILKYSPLHPKDGLGRLLNKVIHL